MYGITFLCQKYGKAHKRWYQTAYSCIKAHPPAAAFITFEIMAAMRFVCKLQYPLKQLHLTAISALFIYFTTLLSTFSICLGSSHSSFNSSTPLSKFNGDLDLTISVETRISNNNNMIHTHSTKLEKRPQNLTMSEDISVGEKCDIFTGSWVHDLSYPLYDSRTCPYLNGGATCQMNGRPDSDYEKWRWKPRDCNIPRLENGIYMFVWC
jgi:hypothetical protein